MTLLHKVDITTHPRGHNAVIKLDGHDIAGGVRSFNLSQQVREPAILELELLVVEETRVGMEDVVVYVGAQAADILTRLGWTPPEKYPKGVEVRTIGA